MRQRERSTRFCHARLREAISGGTGERRSGLSTGCRHPADSCLRHERYIHRVASRSNKGSRNGPVLVDTLRMPAHYSRRTQVGVIYVWSPGGCTKMSLRVHDRLSRQIALASDCSNLPSPCICGRSHSRFLRCATRLDCMSDYSLLATMGWRENIDRALTEKSNQVFRRDYIRERLGSTTSWGYGAGHRRRCRRECVWSGQRAVISPRF